MRSIVSQPSGIHTAGWRTRSTRDIRELDLRASPYELADLGFKPVLIVCDG